MPYASAAQRRSLLVIFSVVFLLIIRGAAFADTWISTGISIPAAKCHPRCDVHYQGDPIAIDVVAPDGLIPDSVKLNCIGPICQFDNWDKPILHKGEILGTFYTRSAALTVTVQADYKSSPGKPSLPRPVKPPPN